MASVRHLFSAVLLVIVLAGCGKPSSSVADAAPAAPVPVTLVGVERRAIDRTVEATGTLFADEDVTVSAKLEGRVVAIAADVSDLVEPGQLLIQIDQRDYELGLVRARTVADASLAQIGLSALPEEPFDTSALPTVVKALAEAANAGAKYERARKLYEQRPPLLSEQDYADIRTARDVARNEADVEILRARALLADARAQAASVAIAQQRLSDATILAPRIIGRDALRYRVAERFVSVGEYVEPGRALMRLVATDVIKFRSHVPERYAGQIRQGERMTMSAGDGAAWPGRVSRVSPAVDPQNRTFMVESLIENPQGRLKPGTFARGSIVLEQEPGVVFVPIEAVMTFAGIDRVFTVVDGKAVQHQVRLGERADGFVEIVGGLGADQVVSPIPGGLAAGMAVEQARPTARGNEG